MATGEVVLHALAVMPLTASNATMATLAGGASPIERYRVANFPGGATEDNYLDFLVYLNDQYDGNGLTIRLPWNTASTTTGNNVVWQVAMRRLQDGTDDVTASSFSAFNTVTDAVPSATANVWTVAEPTFSDGADMDGLLKGEYGILRVRRDADHASDTESGNAARLFYQGVLGKES